MPYSEFERDFAGEQLDAALIGLQPDDREALGIIAFNAEVYAGSNPDVRCEVAGKVLHYAARVDQNNYPTTVDRLLTVAKNLILPPVN